MGQGQTASSSLHLFNGRSSSTIMQRYTRQKLNKGHNIYAVAWLQLISFICELVEVGLSWEHACKTATAIASSENCSSTCCTSSVSLCKITVSFIFKCLLQFCSLCKIAVSFIVFLFQNLYLNLFIYLDWRC